MPGATAAAASESRRPPRALARGGAEPRALEALRGAGPVVAGWLLPFVLILYLALKGGGYDSVVRSEVGIAIWWIVLLGAAVGMLPAQRISRAGWAILAALVAFSAWTALGIGWSESAERSAAELARVATYLGVFALGLAAQGREGLRRTANAAATAIGAVALLAVLSRLQPQWFPASEIPKFLPAAEPRLAYPLNYWNGLAALVAIGLPLLVGATGWSRRLPLQALAAAAIPVMVLALFYTLSRGGAIEACVGLGVLVALHPRRRRLLSNMAVGGVGAAILIASAAQRDALADGLSSGAATAQGDEMLAVMVVVCAGVALAQVALGLAARYEVGPRPRLGRRRLRGLAIGAAVIALAGALGLGLPGELSERWSDFKDPTAPAASAERFDSSSGSGRYQWWQSALDANASEPLTGIGPGTFEFWWAREGTLPGFVRDAHSLYLETLAELGIVGFLLVCGLVAGLLATAVSRTLRADPGSRALLAAMTASCAAFALAAGIDRVWELAVIPAVFLLLAGAILQSRSPAELAEAEASDQRRSATVPRLALAGLALAALAAIVVPLASTTSVRASQDQAQASQLDPALREARTAQNVEPYAASPSLQEALVLELSGDLDGAAAAAQEATREEPTNWRPWLVLSRIEAERGQAESSVAAYREAESLNPRSPLFR